MSGQRLFGTTSKLFPYGKYSNDGGNVGETQYHDQSPGNIPTWSQKFVYYIGQEIYDPTSAAYYRCIVNHAASDVFANDLALVYWVPMSTPSLVTGMRNGLTLTGTFGELGGTLIRNTNIELAGFIFSVADGGIAIANFGARTLHDNAGNSVFNWNTRALVSPNTESVYTWNTGNLTAVISNFTGTSDPEGLIVGNFGDMFYRESLGLTGHAYIKYTGSASNTGWRELIHTGTIANHAWALDGNTVGALKYIGTNDNFDFPIYTNGVEAGRILSTNQNWGIGLTAPTAKLHIKGIGNTNVTSSFYAENLAGTQILKMFDDAGVHMGPVITPTYADGNVYNHIYHSTWLRGGLYMGPDIENHSSNILPGQLCMGRNGEIKFYSDYGGPGEYSYGGWVYTNSTTGLFTVRGGVGGMQVRAGFGAIAIDIAVSTPYMGFNSVYENNTIAYIKGEDNSLYTGLRVVNLAGAAVLTARNNGFVGVGVLTASAGTPIFEARGNVLAGPGTATATGVDSVFHAVRTNTGAPNYYSGWQYVFEVGGGVWGIAMDYTDSRYQFLATTSATFAFGGGSLATPANKVLMYMANGYVGSNTFALYGLGAGISANFHAVGVNQLDTYWGLRIEDSTGAITLSARNDRRVGVKTLNPNSTLEVNGSFSGAYVAKTANYTATVDDFTIDCTANTFNVTLPTAVGIKGRCYNIINSGAGTITLDTTSSQTIGNIAPATSISILPGEVVNVQSDDANWKIYA